MGEPLQAGWDLSSIDPVTGASRRIEVKGRGREWTEDEVVELSRAQIGDAFDALEREGDLTWWLYVIEKLPNGAFNVLPIENPARKAGKWILRGAGWRAVATEPREVPPPNVS